MKRCDWNTTDEIYIQYHDKEWGVPLYDDRKLFEMLILEGAQAGLSWITILKRREAYKVAYDGFDPEKMARWSEKKIHSLMGDASIIRNRLKIEAARTNAKAFLEMKSSGDAFSGFLWSFVHGKPIQNAWKTMSQIPAKTKTSEALSRDLKKRGFRFVGPTICYAFMQSVGMVNDHLVDCFRYEQLKEFRV